MKHGKRCDVCHNHPRPVRLNQWLIVYPRCAACGRPCHKHGHAVRIEATR